MEFTGHLRKMSGGWGFGDNDLGFAGADFRKVEALLAGDDPLKERFLLGRRHDLVRLGHGKG